MDRHTLRVLEFDTICEFLKSFAVSPGAKKRCAALAPSPDRAAVAAMLTETTEMRHDIEDRGPLPLNGVYDIRKAVARSRLQQSYLDPEALLQIRDTLETAASSKKYFEGRQETCPLLYGIAGGIVPLRHLTTRIQNSLSAQGELLDSASPLLSEIRSRLKKLRVSIISTLEGMIGDLDISHAFQDDFITLRNSRYVVPVRSDSKSTVPGVVHDQSQTGATFFVEPLAIVNLNNELQILRKEEYYEEIRILTDLTGEVNEHRDSILADLEIMERIDLIHARALFSKALNASRPSISPTGAIDLRQCRHPILLARFLEAEEPAGEAGGEEPARTEKQGSWEFSRPGIVPVDLFKGPDISTLIITGANAGGKTVAMKTLGLFVLMTQAGMHIPAAPESEIALYDTVFGDIGDEQNIASSLSTFSAHMAQIKSVVTSAGASSLVLLDELGSGTDPSEGGALAGAILDYLRSRGCSSIITTHLNILKTYAYNHDDVENVSVEFDPETLKPTYNLVYGVPGISNALAIARNMGIPEGILANAAGYIDKTEKQVSELIHGLEKTQQGVLAERRALGRVRELAAAHQQAAEGLVNQIKKRRESILRAFESSARKMLRENEEKLMNVIKEQKKRKLIRPGESFSATETARAEFSRIKEALHDTFPRTERPGGKVDHLETGQRVTVFHLKKSGTVVAVDNQARKAEVAIGPLRVKTRFDELVPAPDCGRQAPAQKPRLSAPEPVPGAAQEINIIGMRVEDALPAVDKALDNALLRGADSVDIIHGRGTGRLMKAVREHLEGHRYVSRFCAGSPERGGTGITVAFIKQ